MLQWKVTKDRKKETDFILQHGVVEKGKVFKRECDVNLQENENGNFE